MSLADYLAKNYLTADSKGEKKSKKRKRKDVTNGLVIADDDTMGWENSAAIQEDDGPVTVGGRSVAFRKSKKNNWTTVSAGVTNNSEQATADAILASAAAESSARIDEDDEAPTVDGPIKMESGAHAGLQTAAQLTAQLKKAQDDERRRFVQAGVEESGKGQETIYRDASGRIINIGMRRAEARKKEAEEAAEKAAKIEAQKGDVQRAEAAKRREQLSEAKYLPVARYADDVELNDELKEKELWNDPAAQFMSKKRQGKSVTGKPLYQGPAAPNRYGIRPGHKWDGVDRGIGFEKEYFAAQNKRKSLKSLDYAWQMDE